MNRAPNGEIHLNATKSHRFSLIHQTSASSILNLLLMAAKRSTSSSLRASDCRVNACWWARTRRFSSMVRCCLRTSMKFLKPWELAGVMCRRAGCCVAGGRGLLARSCRCSVLTSWASCHPIRPHPFWNRFISIRPQLQMGCEVDGEISPVSIQEGCCVIKCQPI
jgi:hypothetical protein